MVEADRPVGEEARKSHAARLANGFIATYLAGSDILDIGYKGYREDVVPIVPGATGVELDYPGYDGRTLPFPDASQDAVFASHCLEHIDDHQNAITDWFRVLRVGGFLVVMVPHQFLYEKRASLPSRFNADHKRFYTPASLIQEIEQALLPNTYRLRHLVDNDSHFDYSLPPEQHSGGCYEIELVIEKIAAPSWQLCTLPSIPPAAPTALEPIRDFPERTSVLPASGNPASRALSSPAGDATVWDFGSALPPAPRILALKLDHLGDFVIGIPSLRRLRQAFPASFIRLVVGSWNRAAAEATGLVDEVVTYDFFPQQAKAWDGRPATPIRSFRAAVAGSFDIAIDLRVDEDTRALLNEVQATLRCGIGNRTQLPFLDIALPPEHEQRDRSRPADRADRFLEPRQFGSRMPVQHEFEHVTDFRPVDGHVVFGPHIALPTGRFEVAFDIRLEGWKLGLRRTNVVFDIARDGSEIGVFRRLRAAKVRSLASGGITLVFDNEDPAARYEFRIFVSGRPLFTRLRFGGVRLTQLGALPTARFYPATLHIGEQLSLLVQLVADRAHDLYPASSPPEHQPTRPPRIVIAPFSNSDLRDWPAAHYAALIRLLLDQSTAIIDLVGSPAQMTDLQALTSAVNGGDRVRNLGASQPFSALPDRLRQASLVICNNSGIAHLAAASGARTLAIYSGSHQPQEWGPRGQRAHAITLPIPCSPCGHDRLQDCPNDHRCMADLTAETVFAEVKSLLGR
jgi:ADP-heptose:LPS heptosyltransferase/SAM-dependent methyltransferase